MAIEKKMHLELMNLKAMEKMFFGQKLKCTYFKECDWGTKFFHALLSQNHKINFIHVVQHSDGHLTTPVDKVGAKFVNFYKQLLGSFKVTLPLDVEIVHYRPCLDEAVNASLLAPISNDDIKIALFSIGIDKSSGPNGYSSYFFKKAWDVIGEEFCVIVWDFFVFGQLLKQINHSIIALVPKSANVTSTNNFQPISYCNVVYD